MILQPSTKGYFRYIIYDVSLGQTAMHLVGQNKTNKTNCLIASISLVQFCNLLIAGPINLNQFLRLSS